MTPQRLLSGAAALAVALGIFYLVAKIPGPTSSSDRPRPARDFSLPDLQGKRESLSSYKGKLILLDFWATWCDPCREEIPELKNLYAKYRDRGFVIVGVALDFDGKASVAPFVREAAIGYPVLLGEGLAPPGYEVSGIPTAYLIDRRGLIVRRFVGPQTFEDFVPDIEKYLAR
jgi:thiol-disulfide isomerase/thioredoxin